MEAALPSPTLPTPSRLLAGLAAAALVAACAPAAPEAANAPRPAPAAAAPPGGIEALLAGVPNVEIGYYEVQGDSLAEIRRALNEVRPRDPNDGLRVDALASWYIDWRWPQGPGGRCDLSRAEIRFRAWVRLPRLVERATTPRAVRLRWRAYMAMLERHEANHIRRAWERSGRVLAALRVSTCAAASRDGLAAVAEIGRGDRDYDRATRHGFTEGAHFP